MTIKMFTIATGCIIYYFDLILLTRKPGKPFALGFGMDSIVITWSKPEAFENGDVYQVSYKKTSRESTWEMISQHFHDNKGHVRDLWQNCEYIFRVSCVYSDGEVSCSNESDPIKTNMVDFARLTERPTPPNYPKVCTLLRTETSNCTTPTANITKFEIGSIESNYQEEKTIMMIGETGTGKSTLVDGMVNYILGVKRTDNYRFTLVTLDEEAERHTDNKGLSNTERVTCYTVHPMKGSRIPYTLNVIDTPGFGEARGIDRDDEICDQIRELLTVKEQNRILTIDAVCYVIKAQATGPTPKQRTIFQLIMSSFGNDIAHNICSMITFANGLDHTNFSSFDETRLPFGKRFTFDNPDLHLSLSLSNKSSFERFFNHLDKMERISLRLTLDVLNDRKRLEDMIQNIEIKVEAGNIPIKQLQMAMQSCARSKDTIAMYNKSVAMHENKSELEQITHFIEYRKLRKKKQIADRLRPEVTEIAACIRAMMTLIKDSQKRLAISAICPNPLTNSLTMPDYLELTTKNTEMNETKMIYKSLLQKHRSRSILFRNVDDFLNLAREAESETWDGSSHSCTLL